MAVPHDRPDSLSVGDIRAGAVLLESADLPIDGVAGPVGLTAAGFRHHFREAMGVSPSTYRRQFRR
ncbi:hypothetical protein ACIQU4_25875 [Streptomyces sp. NPDC090741]|uniref:hypothetical protein n=1 Tax=Streptomyces sp. NPDC090741 TaxID=3365967 RepID=UPI00380B35D8